MAGCWEEIEKELDNKIKKNLLEIFPHISEQAIQRRITHYRNTWEFPLNPPHLLQLCITDFLDMPINKEDLVVPVNDTVNSSNTFVSAIDKYDAKQIDYDDDSVLIEAVDIMNRDSQSSFQSEVIVLDSSPNVGHIGSGQTSGLTELDHDSKTDGQILFAEMQPQSSSRREMKKESTDWEDSLPKIQIGHNRQSGKTMPSSTGSVFTNIKLNLGVGNLHNINTVNCQSSSSATLNAQTSSSKSTSVLSPQQSSSVISTSLTGSSPCRPLGPSQLVCFSPSALTFSPNVDSVILTPLPGFPMSSHYYLDIGNMRPQMAISAVDPPVAMSSQIHFHNKLSQNTNIGQTQVLNQPEMNISVKSDTCTSNQPLPRLLSKTPIQHRTSNKHSFSLGPLPSLTPSPFSASPLSAPQPENMIKPGRGILGTEIIHKVGQDEQQPTDWKLIFQGDSYANNGTNNLEASAVDAVNTTLIAEKTLGEKLVQMYIPEDGGAKAAATDMGQRTHTKPAVGQAAVYPKYGPLLTAVGQTAVYPKYGPLLTAVETFTPANNPAMQPSLVKDNPQRPQINQQTIPSNIPATLTTTAVSAPKDPYEEILQEVLVMFPDVDPSYVLEYLRGQQNGFLLNAVCNYLLETNYPKVKNSTEALCTTVMSTHVICGLCFFCLDYAFSSSRVGKYAKDLQQMVLTAASLGAQHKEIDYYKDYKSIDNRYNKNYIWQCTELLTTEFKWVSAINIQQVMKLFLFCYAPSHRALKQVWKTVMEKVPADYLLGPIVAELWPFFLQVQICTRGDQCNQHSSGTIENILLQFGQSPSGFQFTAAIERENHPTHITFRLLKHCRKSKMISNLDPQLQREVDFVKLKNLEELEEMDYQLALKMNENEYEEFGQQIECGCCYGEFAFESLLQCYDGHLFCGDCLQKYAEESVFGQGKAELSCMTDSCKATFPLSQLMKALPSHIISKYEDRIQEENINLADLEDLVRCPFCGFAALLDSTYTVFSCQNSSCLKESCRLCQVEWSEHFGKKCSDIEKKDETELRLEFEEKMTLAKIRVCHKCKTKFTKTDGCNKMTCRCGAKMCYICRKRDIDYNHFCRHPRDPGMSCNKCKNCSLWTNPDEDDDRAVKEIQLEASKIRKEKGFLEEKLIGAPEEPPVKKIKTNELES